MNVKTRSPLKDKPLRYVAQSTDEAIDDLVIEKILGHYTVVVIVLMILAHEWQRYYWPLAKPPILMTIFGGGVCIFSIYKFVKHYRKLKNLKLGRNGERAVGQYLESYREFGCKIFHDIKGDSFNVDHVLISDKGIFVIETKTYSKPEKGDAKIDFDGQRILVNGKESQTDIIVQVTAATSYIKKVLKDSTGKDFEPFPVVLFPGWFVGGNGNKQGKLWVLEPKAFEKFLGYRTVILSPGDVALASYHLSRHIRTS